MVEFKRFGENTLTTFFSDSLEKKSVNMRVPDFLYLFQYFILKPKEQISRSRIFTDFLQ